MEKIQTETTQTFKHAELIEGRLEDIDNNGRTITLALGTVDDNGNFHYEFEYERATDQQERQYETIKIPEGFHVNPNHLGTYYELRVIDGVLDPTHELD